MKVTHFSRRHFLSRAGTGLVLAAGSTLCLPVVANAAIAVRVLQPGDVFFGRKDAEDQPDWGYWRHVALWDGSRIIEGGTGLTKSKVGATDLRQFERRYKIIMVQRLKGASGFYGPKMAEEAYARLGDRMTCSYLIQAVYNAAFGAKVNWLKPDHVAAAAQFKSVLSQHS